MWKSNIWFENKKIRSRQCPIDNGPTAALPPFALMTVLEVVFAQSEFAMAWWLEPNLFFHQRRCDANIAHMTLWSDFVYFIQGSYISVHEICTETISLFFITKKRMKWKRLTASLWFMVWCIQKWQRLMCRECYTYARGISYVTKTKLDGPLSLDKCTALHFLKEKDLAEEMQELDTK